ncbi:hypothetical protein JQC92_19070 [Shewanella sp. 202IG2-18]|uniref:hypothetical protein n=1 Tax=Parashewanella hymeniacidonis TaxID=2807618 RepID=UPI001960C5E6|nr:hypothetical protein [Parashewanella hymeniacidonis]MBM7074109.1 hypothetical protein [Parashewanella hymeniacidonis]
MAVQNSLVIVTQDPSSSAYNYEASAFNDFLRKCEVGQQGKTFTATLYVNQGNKQYELGVHVRKTSERYLSVNEDAFTKIGKLFSSNNSQIIAGFLTQLNTNFSSSTAVKHDTAPRVAGDKIGKSDKSTFKTKEGSADHHPKISSFHKSEKPVLQLKPDGKKELASTKYSTIKTLMYQRAIATDAKVKNFTVDEFMTAMDHNMDWAKPFTNNKGKADALRSVLPFLEVTFPKGASSAKTPLVAHQRSSVLIPSSVTDSDSSPVSPEGASTYVKLPHPNHLERVSREPITLYHTADSINNDFSTPAMAEHEPVSGPKQKPDFTYKNELLPSGCPSEISFPYYYSIQQSHTSSDRTNLTSRQSPSSLSHRYAPLLQPENDEGYPQHDEHFSNRPSSLGAQPYCDPFERPSSLGAQNVGNAPNVQAVSGEKTHQLADLTIKNSTYNQSQKPEWVDQQINDLTDVNLKGKVTEPGEGCIFCFDLDEVIIKVKYKDWSGTDLPEFEFVDPAFPEKIARLKSTYHKATFVVVTHTPEKILERKLSSIEQFGYKKDWFAAHIAKQGSKSAALKEQLPELGIKLEDVKHVVMLDDDASNLRDMRGGFESVTTIQPMAAILDKLLTFCVQNGYVEGGAPDLLALRSFHDPHDTFDDMYYQWCSFYGHEYVPLQDDQEDSFRLW